MRKVIYSNDGFIYEDNEFDSDLQRENPPRSKTEFPYSYDPFTTWGGPSEKCNGSVYTDRMSQWDYEKFHTLGKRIFGEGPVWFGSGCNGTKVEEFLRAYNDNQEMKLLRVVEYCNVATGYPTWRLDYFNPKSGK